MSRQMGRVIQGLGEMILLMLQAPFRWVARASRLKTPRSTRSLPPPVSAHRIRIVESSQFIEMGPAVAELLRWSYFDLRENPFEPMDTELKSELLKGMKRQRKLVLSCSHREVQADEPDGLTVVVDDVCDLNQSNTSHCLQKIMIALRPTATSTNREPDPDDLDPDRSTRFARDGRRDSGRGPRGLRGLK